MSEDFLAALILILRLVLFGGVAWGAWICLTYAWFPARSEKASRLEHFATLALLLLLFTTLGGFLHAR